MTRLLLAICLSACSIAAALAGERIDVWPDLAPGESVRTTGEDLPYRAGEIPPVTRTIKIRRPTMDVFLPKNPSGTAVLILPGGGFAKVVPDKEGSEAATWLNQLGIAAFVLRYRTNEVTPDDEPAYVRPLQDAQRALCLIRSKSEAWKIDANRVGVLAFSAGGQVGAILHTATELSYPSVDDIDKHSNRPSFSMLIYPWRITGADGELMPEIKVTKDVPPAFLVHTHDDASTSLGSVLVYAALKQHGVSAELHVYENGGHGYGMRKVNGSAIGSWPDRATQWLALRGLSGPSR